jgi:DNA polymerase elongation subunit (family B)
MYPSQLVNFCLDSSNITDDTDNAININGVLFRQDKKALLPYLTKKLMNIKDSLKKELKAIALDNTEHKVLQMKYDAYKGLVNSIYGVTAFSSFRLYDYKVASSITFLARDLLHFVEDEMKIRGYKVIYTDTDALMYSADEDKIDLLNDLVQQWGRKYGKDSIDIMFESEGKFEKLLILGRTHYYGYLLTSKGVKKEIKGIEMKRSSSSKYEAYFQEQLIEKVLNKIPSNLIKTWIESEKELIKTKDIEELSYPCKIAVKKYKNLPVFMRAYENTKNLTKNFKLNKGEGFYYIYIHSIGCDKNNRAIDVLAFTKENKSIIDKTRINWKEMIDRSIDNKVNKVFSAIGITQITEEVLF